MESCQRSLSRADSAETECGKIDCHAGEFTLVRVTAAFTESPTPHSFSSFARKRGSPNVEPSRAELRGPRGRAETDPIDGS